MRMTHPQYIGRFAPSPSGPLHFGSLIAALGSYLRARQQQGKWLIRIEDIDPPRETKGAATNILQTLEQFGFEWDDEVLYQSLRSDNYQAQLQALIDHEQAYYCQCTRKQIQTRGGVYDGRCFNLTPQLQQGAIRIRNTAGVDRYHDQVMGIVKVGPAFAKEDFIIKRSDGLFAYQLAVVMDDHYQGITEIVRGSDLLEASCRQLSLNQIFGFNSPKLVHLPLACTRPGFKLSKQNHADAIAQLPPQQTLNNALMFLGQAKVEPEQNMAHMLAQAVAQFDLASIPQQSEILISG